MKWMIRIKLTVVIRSLVDNIIMNRFFFQSVLFDSVLF